jgi:NAD(P)-dependent dehydrogenase (short-subunit alcohol dehydrogenase family)
MTIRCDVSYQTDVNEMVKSVVQAWGKLDVLFNVAGIIEVGPLEAMTQDDFKRAMDTHFWGPLNTMLAAIPHMRAKGWGRILNVSSMGGKRAVPHMIPYDASKFALVGLSQGMRTELVKDGIYVTTACPSLMRTGSPRNASFKAQHRKEYAWFSVSDSLPLLSMNSKRAAELMVNATQYGDADLLLPSTSRIALAFSDLFPNLTADVMYALNALLPRMGGIGTSSAFGYESESKISESMLTRLGRQAALRNNEVNPDSFSL